MTRAAPDVAAIFEGSTSTLTFDDGSTSTASELVEDARRLAGRLAADGRQVGDRIVVHLPNTAEHVRLLLACAVGGFVAVAVNTRYSPDEVDDLIRRSGAHRVDGATISQGVPDDPASERHGGEATRDRVDRRDDPFVVFTTSGTTSRPKMVLHRQHSIADHARDAAAAFGHSDEDTVLLALPLCGTFGQASLMAAVAGNARIVVTDFDLDRTARLIGRHGVTCMNGSDDMFHRLLDHGADLSTIRLGGYARFNTSLDGIVARAEAAGATLTGLYGMSEVQALFSLRDPAGPIGVREKPGGTLVSSAAARRIVDGELQVRGPSLFAGYLAEGGDRIDDELTARHLAVAAADDDDGGAWFRTGDLARDDDTDDSDSDVAGRADPDRSFEYLARLGDVLRLGGFLVSPAEIESVLMEADEIEAAQVVAVDRPGGARPVAFVVLAGTRTDATSARASDVVDATGRDGHATRVPGKSQHLDEAATIERCAARLARYKVPVRVIVLDRFPTTDSANGTKIRKVELRRMGAAALDGRPQRPVEEGSAPTRS